LQIRDPAARITAACASLLSIGCAALAPVPRALRFDVSGAAPREVPIDALPLASGQIVLSESGGALSLFFALFAEDFSDYVHAGLIAVEDGKPYVYESVGVAWPSFGRAPTYAIRGTARRLPFSSFVRRYQFVAIYDPAPELDVEVALAFARDAVARGVPFDPFFGLDSETLYCTEFVAAALEAGGAARVRQTALRSNRSLGVALRWLGIEATRVILAKDLVDPAREVARVSAHRNPEEAPLYFAQKRELHARFTPDQRLGAVFRWGMGSLHLRASVRDYLAAGRARAAVDPPQRADAARRAAAELAAQFFEAAAESPARAASRR
jgi:hypothetical protein